MMARDVADFSVSRMIALVACVMRVMSLREQRTL